MDDNKNFDPKYIGIGLVLGGLLLGFFFVLSQMIGLRTGFQGIAPNATWYQPTETADQDHAAEENGGGH